MHQVLRVAIFSKYPTRYVLSKVVPKLNQRGIVAERVYEVTKMSPAQMNGVDCVLVMHELLSHSEFDRIRSVATRAQKPIYTLSRKSAVWTRELEILFNWAESNASMAKPKSVKDDQLEFLLTDVWKARKQGKSYDDIVPHVRKYWSYGSLDSGTQLSRYVHNALDREVCPAWWRRYVAGDPDAAPGSVEESEPVVVCGDAPVGEPTLPAPPAVMQSQDDKELAAIYAEENASLRDENVVLRTKVEKLEKTVEELTQKLRTAKKSTTANDVIDAYRRLAHSALHAMQTMDRFHGFTSRDPSTPEASCAEEADSSAGQAAE